MTPRIASRSRLRTLAASPPGRGGGAPPAPPVLDWYSTWGYALGDGADARGDGASGSRKWDTFIGNAVVNEVIASTGLDFPTPRVLKNTASSSALVDAVLRKTGLPVPAIGESQYTRFYARVPSAMAVCVEDPDTHPVQDGSAASQINWGWWFIQSGGGTWTPRYQQSQPANPANYIWVADAPLNYDQTYRFESQVDRTGTTTFKGAVRIYDSSNVLVRGSENFILSGGSTPLDTFMATNDFTFFSAANLAGLNAGYNGQGGTDWYPTVIESYQGAVAVSRDTWCGPYDAENEP
mgnify:CR=1 FL=1